MTITERDAVARGATFWWEDDAPRLRAPTVIIPLLRAEVARRAELFKARLPRTGYIPVIAIGPRAPKRWGECMWCADPLLAGEAHVSRTCWLCVAALGHAKKAVGWTVT